MNTTLSPVTIKRFSELQSELIPQVGTDMEGLSPKLEQLLRAFEFTEIERHVFEDRRYAQPRGAGQPEYDRCALACAFLAKAVYDLKTTRALIERLEADRKLRRLCGFDLRYALPSESTFSRAFDEFARSKLGQKAHEAMITTHLGSQAVGSISRDSTAIIARESLPQKSEEEKQAAKKEEEAKKAQPKPPRGRPKKGEERAKPALPALELQRGKTPKEILQGINTLCATGTKVNAQGYKISWCGYKLHADTAECGIVINVELTGANVHDSLVALAMSPISATRTIIYYEVMDAAYCSEVIRQEIAAQGRVALIDHNPRGGDKKEFAPHEAQHYKVRSGAERSNARLKDEFGARHVQVRGHAKVMCHLMFGVLALCSDQFMRLLQSSK